MLPTGSAPAPRISSAGASVDAAGSGEGKKPSNSSQPRIRRRNRLITSCLECRRRKLKCDKTQPCSNCVRFTRDCVFLAASMDPAAQMKLAEIKEKMGSLERSLEQDLARRGSAAGLRSEGTSNLPGLDELDSEDELSAPEDERDLEPNILITDEVTYENDADDGEVMDLGISFGKLRVTERIGGFPRPKMAEELGNAFKEVSSGQTSAPGVPGFDLAPQQFLGPGPEYFAPASSFFFSNHPAYASHIQSLPDKPLADKLIAQYFRAVHPIARLVHRPTFERQYAQFWHEYRTGVEPRTSFVALLLAAMLSAVISMQDEIIRQHFAMSKADLVDHYLKGTEAALSRAHILKTTKLESLQAFVMYLLPLCRAEVSRTHSALTGTAIRLAECMGLHRDGSYYGLSAVDVHVRRLIWHQLCFLDIRTCEASGPRPQIRADEFDTKFPLAVDDIDLESSTPPAKDSGRWTDNSLSLVRFECNELHRYIWNERPKIEKKKSSLTALLGKVEKFKTAMEKKHFRNIDQLDPIQMLALHVYGLLYRRMHVMILHRYHSTEERLMPERLREIMLTSATFVLEHAIEIETNPLFRPWSWYIGALSQYHPALLLLREMYPKPVAGQVAKRLPYEDRIWRTLDYAFDVPSHLTPREKAGFIFGGLRDRAMMYQVYRKMKAPTSMEKTGLKEDPGAQDIAPQAQAQAPVGPQPPAMGQGTDLTFAGMANGEPLFAPPIQSQTSPRSGSEGSGSVQGQNSNSPQKTTDSMLDVDWNQLNDLYPPDTSSGNIVFQPFTYVPPPSTSGGGQGFNIPQSFTFPASGGMGGW